jgi:DNA-binding response OmpR family regulator
MRTVLLVEDEPLIALLYEDVLQDTEFTLTDVAVCNKTAIASLAANPPDLAVVDYFLEDGPCLALVEKLREIGVPFVIVSGHEEAGDDALVGVPWLPKPFEGDVLLGALRTVQARRGEMSMRR